MPSLTVVKPSSAAGRALAYIVANPGCKFVEIHAAIDGRPSLNSTCRATAKLVSVGRIRKVRDGKCVRHYPTDV